MSNGRAVADRITAYLAGGGLFNPELANHDAVRDLLIDARASIESLEDYRSRFGCPYIREIISEGDGYSKLHNIISATPTPDGLNVVIAR